PIQQFGVILGACTLLTALLVLAISPAAMLPPFRMEVPVRFGSTSRIGAGMSRLIGGVTRHPLAILVGVLAVVLPITSGMTRLRYESNYINAFKPQTRVVRDYHMVESRLGGIGLVEIVVPVPPGPALGEHTLGELREVERSIAGIRRGDAPAVAHVLSLATVLDPDGRLASLPPATRTRVLADKLDLIAATPQAELLSVLAEERSVRISSTWEPAPAKAAIFREALAATRAEFGPRASLTGLSFLLTRTTEAIIVTQWATILTSTLGILAMLTLALRRPTLAVLALVPTLLAVALVLGLMGWLGVKLDLATALVASVALGLSVDDTFHCLLQFRRERAELPFRESLFASYAVTGPGVLLSSLAVAVGFAALWFSEFAPFSIFGMMVGIATAGSTLGNLVLLPACLTLGDRLLSRLKAEPDLIETSPRWPGRPCGLGRPRGSREGLLSPEGGISPWQGARPGITGPAKG
ncbi:MAG: MMPL family transporter, partial [Singulisphaera sp.]